MTHHGEGLRRLIQNETVIEQLKSDFRQAPLSERDRAMLEYAVKLTIEPWNMTPTDVERLRRVGFTDADILDINQVTAYFAFVNRLADGLGVELEPYWSSDR